MQALPGDKAYGAIRALEAETGCRDQFLHEVKHASGQNYIIGRPERAYSFECSSHKVSRFIPEEAVELVWQTIYPRYPSR
jgi:hypothetical protein